MPYMFNRYLSCYLFVLTIPTLWTGDVLRGAWLQNNKIMVLGALHQEQAIRGWAAKVFPTLLTF